MKYHDMNHVYHYGLSEGEESIGFDLDGVLITTKSGNVHPKDENDWVLCHADIPEKLQSFHDVGYSLVIFTNQLKGIAKEKLDAIVAVLNVPIDIYVSGKYDDHRKPGWGMADSYMLETGKKIIEFYGDAAGRESITKMPGWKYHKTYKKDFSASDYWFAQRIGATFKVAEALIFDMPVYRLVVPKWKPFFIPVFDDDTYIVLMCGLPASGKSGLAAQLGMEIVSNDTNTMKLLPSILQQKRSVVVDNTNYTSSIRADVLKMAKGYKTCILHINTPAEICIELENYRTSMGGIKLSSMAIRAINSKFMVPTPDEADHVITIPYKELFHSAVTAEVRWITK